MNALLFSMPDTMPNFRTGLNTWPNLGLCSLAAAAPRHDAVVADLCCCRRDIRAGVKEALDAVRPSFVGLSGMTFQFHTACGVARLVREYDPHIKICAGGYHATLMHEEIAQGEQSNLFDFLIRHEGEQSFPRLLDCLEKIQNPKSKIQNGFADIPGLSFRDNGQWVHNPPPKANLDLSAIALPRRSAQLWPRFGVYGKRVALVESSRGCTMACKFCSMSGMYGRTFREYDLQRVLDDITAAKKNGARIIGFVDDNITLNIPRFERLCDMLIAAGHDDIYYFVQASSHGIGMHPGLVRKMRRVGFAIVFLGVENINTRNLKLMRKGDITEKSRRAIENLHNNNIICIGGIIVGHPDDREEDIAPNYEFLRDNEVEYYLDQIICPYPKTASRDDLLELGAVTNPDDYRYYNGFWANVRTKHLTSDELQFLKWKYHRQHSLRFRPEPKTFARRFPISSLFRRYALFPFRQMRDRRKYGHMTEHELYRMSIDKTWHQNQFFADKPPSTHLDVGHPHPLREPEYRGILAVEAGLI
ncbi:MAG: radical SAM protein [Planctomycetota bacterium]